MGPTYFMSGTNLAGLLSWVVQTGVYFILVFILHVLLSFLCVFVMPPLLKKGAYRFASVRTSVCPYVRPEKFVLHITLKRFVL